MGEIKSTLELIMEKTKGLNMSEEEKQAYRDEEMKKKIRGLLRKGMDGAMDMDRLKMKITALAGGREEKVRDIVIQEILPSIHLDRDNEVVLTLLEG